MNPSLGNATLAPIVDALRRANQAFVAARPGDPPGRQPVHTVYGGAHLFKADVAGKLGAAALRALHEYAPDFATFGRAVGLPGAEHIADVPKRFSAAKAQLTVEAASQRPTESPTALAHFIYTRVEEKLQREAVEDFRIDFEDGYGHRPDAEEDGHAVAAAREVARGFTERLLPPFIGIRLKPLSEELRDRSLRTLDLFVSTLAKAAGGRLPPHFVVTLPKITAPEQVAALADVFDALERAVELPAGSLRMELMIETPQSIFDAEGRIALPTLIARARGRCVAAHFGTYDYTASCNITARHQHMMHPGCDFARQVMQVGLAGTGVWLSDGATNIMPVPVNRSDTRLTEEQRDANRHAVHGAWRLHYQHIQHSLALGLYQGWDLHPAQLPTRYAALYAFFLESLDAASTRLRNFVEKAAQATLIGEVFDDAATGQGLLNYFLRAVNCGALTEDEAVVLSGLTLDELRSRSFVKILNNRRRAGL
jgi:citrate lyase beta subunit